MILDHTYLIVADPDFIKDEEMAKAYLDKLKDILSKRLKGADPRFITVTGKYGIPEMDALEIDSKNKTSFVKSVDELIDRFDELVIINNFEHEPYLESLQNQINERAKGITVYGY